MQSSLFTLLIGMPGGSEWIMIILALAVIAAPIVLVVYLFKVYSNRKREKHIIRKL